MKNYLKKQFSNGFRNRAVIALIVFLLFSWFIFLKLNAGILGNKIITENADVEAGMTIQKAKYVKLDSTSIYFTGMYYTLDDKAQAKYYMVDLADRYILALLPLFTPDFAEDYDLTGRLRVVDNIDRGAIEDLHNYYITEEGWTKEIAEIEIPKDYVIESSEYKPGYVQTFYIQIVGTIISAIITMYFMTIAVNPRKNKSYRKLERYGDINKVIEEVDRDLESDIKYYDTKNIKIMQNYVISKTMFKIEIYKTDEIMWIYKLITQQRYNGVPTGKIYSLEIKFSGGQKERIGIRCKNEKDADQKLEELSSKLTKAIFGYSDELMTQYTKNFEEFKKMWREKCKE